LVPPTEFESVLPA